MVLVDHTAPVAARTRSAAQLDETEMKRSASFAGTVNIGLALGDQNKQKPLPDWRDLILPGCYGALAGLAMVSSSRTRVIVDVMGPVWRSFAQLSQSIV